MTQMYQAGLILEGGGMRGMYTAGVLDAFLDKEIEFSSIYGVSAGACHACSFISKQRGRAFRVGVDYLDDPNYCSFKSFLKTGDLFGADFTYEQIPDVLDPFDYDTFRDYKGKFYAVVTNVQTGQAEYKRVRDGEKHLWMVRASASLPMVSRTIAVNGKYYLDGGIADSIPIRKSIKDGNEKNVVVLTRDASYRKEPNGMLPLMKLRYPGKKAFLDAVENRHIHYNEVLQFLEEEEKAGRIFVIRPSEEVEVRRIEKDRDKLEALYQKGLEDGMERADDMIAYLEQ